MKIRAIVTIEVYEEGHTDPEVRSAHTEVISSNEGGNPRFIADQARRNTVAAMDLIVDPLVVRFGDVPA